MTFHEDLRFATVYEKRVVELFESTEHWFSPKGSKEYDVGIRLNDDPEVLFEVKADRKTINTGNIAIEFECRGKPSGITTSKSDYWVYFLDGKNQYLLIPTDRLRNEIAKESYKRKVSGGDDGVARMYLFGLETFMDCLNSY